MTEPEPPSVAALSLAETATQPATKASEQEINPWDVQAAVYIAAMGHKTHK
jgi:tryptophanyl-tRNA synthetase